MITLVLHYTIVSSPHGLYRTEYDEMDPLESGTEDCVLHTNPLTQVYGVRSTRA